jgi:uncharacterized protein (TIGR00251 family)
MSDLKTEKINNGISFKVKVVPGSSKTSISGILDGMLKIKVAAPPEKGKANSAVIDFLSKVLSMKKNAITITSGRTNPVKTISIETIDKNILLEKLHVKGL